MTHHPHATTMSDGSPSGISRRDFMNRAGAAAVTVNVVPAHILGRTRSVAASEKVRVACIGVGSQGLRVMMEFLQLPDVQIVAVCDVNAGCDDYVEWGRHELRDKARDVLNDTTWGSLADGALAGMGPAQDIVQRYYAKRSRRAIFRGCSAYRDYRELLEHEKDVDAVIIGTPDHSHAVIAAHAMRLGKHVYCQKPMTHSVHEAVVLAELARETGVATQVSTYNAASEATRQLCEWIWAGAIGPVREVHNWSSRPLWPQALQRPAETDPIPEYLDWDLWLGPAPERPYNRLYEPFVWRGWHDFGTGSIGDMGCYSFDTIFRVLKLTAPIRVEGSSTALYDETFPAATNIHFDFPARGDMPPVTIHWYDGRVRPRKPVELDEGPYENEGLLFVGDEGKILCKFTGDAPRLIPRAAMEAFTPPEPTLPRSPGHLQEWVTACKGGPAADVRFEVAGPVTETILLGNIAVRMREVLHWDAEAKAVTNVDDANALLKNTYRDGWRL